MQFLCWRNVCLHPRILSYKRVGNLDDSWLSPHCLYTKALWSSVIGILVQCHSKNGTPVPRILEVGAQIKPFFRGGTHYFGLSSLVWFPTLPAFQSEQSKRGGRVWANGLPLGVAQEFHSVLIIRYKCNYVSR